MKSLGRVRLLVTPWTAARQAPPSTGFSRQEWKGIQNKTTQPLTDKTVRGLSEFTLILCHLSTVVYNQAETDCSSKLCKRSTGISKSNTIKGNEKTSLLAQPTYTQGSRGSVYTMDPYEGTQYLRTGIIYLGFPGISDGKESACNAGHPGSIPRLGRSPAEENGSPLQYSCLENSMNRGAQQAFHGLQRVRHYGATTYYLPMLSPL